MEEKCPKCGLLKDICACEILEKEEVQRIKVYSTTKKFKKLVTIIEGLDKNKLEKTVKELKRKLACGGTVKDGVVVLQGEHRDKIKGLLISLGYSEESISIQ